jgi:hypothetical protein
MPPTKFIPSVYMLRKKKEKVMPSKRGVKVVEIRPKFLFVFFRSNNFLLKSLELTSIKMAQGFSTLDKNDKKFTFTRGVC